MRTPPFQVGWCQKRSSKESRYLFFLRVTNPLTHQPPRCLWQSQSGPAFSDGSNKVLFILPAEVVSEETWWGVRTSTIAQRCQGLPHHVVSRDSVRSQTSHLHMEVTRRSPFTSVTIKCEYLHVAIKRRHPFLPLTEQCQRKPSKPEDLNKIQSLIHNMKVSRFQLKVIPRTRKISN